jgi:hypothetical protein
MRGLIMIRTIWVTAFCLAVLGGLFATKVTASIPVTDSSELTAAEAVFEPDTLTKADKLSVTDVPHSTETIALPTAEPVEPKPVVADLVEAKPVEIKTVAIKPGAAAIPAPHLADPLPRRTAVMLPRPRPKPRPAKSDTPVKTAAEAQPCHPPEGIAGLIDALNGVPRCNL